MQLQNIQIKKSFIIGVVFWMAGVITPLSFAYSESLSGYTANGTVSTSSTSFGTVASVTVPASATARNILVTASFSSAATNNLSSDKSLQFNLTDGAGNNTMNMTLRGVGGGNADSRSGQIVNLFTSVSAATTYSIQHAVGSSSDQIQTKAVITAIPLLTTQNTVALAGAGALQTTQQSVSGATFTAISGTTITVDTTTPGYANIPGDFFVIASLEDYRTSGTGKDTGEWQFQYSSDGGSVWNSFGHSTRQAILASNQSGIIKIADVLTNQTPSANYQFRLVHRVETGSNTIYSNNINIISIFTGIKVSGNNLNFPTYSAYVASSETTSTTLTESVGYSFSRADINTDLFVYSRCYMSMNGNDSALCDIYLDPTPPTFTPIVHDRYIVNTNDIGSQGHVGLATDLSAGTSYRTSMRDATVSGKTMSSNDLIIILWDLNTAALQADLSTSKTCETLIPGQTGVLAYTIVVTNNGPNTATAVSLADTLPAGLSNATYTVDGGGSSSWSSPASLGDMTNGNSHTIRIYADVSPSITSISANTATVSSSTTDSTPANNSSSCTNTVTPQADLSITKACSALVPGQAGSQLAYTITITNSGPSSAQSVTLTDAIPAELASPTWTLDAVSMGAWTSPASLGALSPGGHTVTISGSVAPDVTSIGSNTASVSSPTDTNPANDTSNTCTNAINPSADLSVSKTCGNLFPGATGALVYTLVVENSGPSTATSVTLTDSIPSGNPSDLTNVTFTVDGGSSASWTGSTSFAGMATSVSHTVRIYADIPSDLTSMDANTASVSSSATDPDSGNNSSACTNVIASQQADLSIAKTCSPLTGGQTGVSAYTITVTNNGPDTSPAVSVTDTLPAGLNNATWNLDSANQGSWTGSTLLGSMNSGVSHTIEIFADVDPLIASVNDNTASVIDPGIYDPTPANNSATCSTGFIPGPTVSRRALNFITGSNSNVAVAANSSLNLTTTGTLEAWIYPAEFTDDAGIVVKGTSAACYGFGLGGGSLFSGGTSQNIGFVLYDTTGTKYLLTADAYPLIANKWYHIACVWDLGASPQMAIYINGIKEAESSPAVPDVRINAEDLVIGLQNITSAEFAGVIDEVRVWDAARIQTRIQDTMCHNINNTESDFANLTGNWRFDEDSGATCGDYSGHGNLGTITNAERICSTAPIGDASMHDYDDTGGFGVVFANPAQDERLTVSAETPADWSEALKSGLQTYRVNTPANDQSGPTGLRLFNDSGYWGVFVTGGAEPTYMIEYNYDVSDDGFPGIGNKDNLRLTWRHGNCENWKNLDAAPGTNTLTQTGLTGTEFILGTNVDPRNTINFVSANSNYVVVTDGVAGGDLDPTTYGAIEAWINIASYQDNAGIIHKGDGTNDSYSLYMGTDTGGNENQYVYFTVDAGGGSSNTIHSTYPLNLNTWYHIAGTWDDVADTMILYINGVQDQDVLPSATVTAQETNNNLFIGVRPTGVAGYFNGNIDEVRIWHITAPANMRTRTLIRDTMCQKLAGSETDLGAYWRFDEETGSVNCPDYSGNGHAGTMTGFGADGSNAIRNARVCSSAPIGDDSAYDYYDGGAAGTVSAQLAHSDGDYMFGTESAGTWTGQFSGIQIYRLDEAPIYPPDLWTTPDPPYSYTTPNGLTPPASWSSIDYYRYWGVFVTDWDDVTNQPVYDAVYYYTGNPSVPVDDSVVALARRPEYCFGTWTDSGYVLDYLVNNTLTVTGDSQFGPPATNPEYVLGGKDAPLAITLASFTADVDEPGNCIEINWETATEIDTAGFYLWRSDKKDGSYTRIDGSFTRSKALMETMGAAYDYLDCDVDLNAGGYYYKLEEIDFDETKDNPFYGPTGPVSQTVSASQAVNNESGDSKGLGCFIDVIAE